MKYWEIIADTVKLVGVGAASQSLIPKAGLQKVTAQVELTKPAPQTVVDNH